ncbi:hypothetical protein ACO0QE_002588 [Hanseniaspora vineae]
MIMFYELVFCKEEEEEEEEEEEDKGLYGLHMMVEVFVLKLNVMDTTSTQISHITSSNFSYFII